ncbi:hypothetical protein [Ureibacillus sp. FSL E2-3493]|uniref:hypothetical protein n=1 Tax=Ureibacillus sp. FSL E2-3493 TaxID=2921367 RepID=UPI003119996C
MKTYKIILLAILAGIYSGILDDFELHYMIRVLLLIVLVCITGFVLNTIGRKPKE